MEITLINSTGNMKAIREMIEFGQKCARVCYTEKDWAELEKEPINENLLKHLLESGHHSVFEHIALNFNFNKIPKALAMVFNNEKLYSTSEKSARYTVMSEIEPEQAEIYLKWMDLLIPEIRKTYPEMEDEKIREKEIKKLAQENARYMTSVFTPTKMVHTLNLRQLNFIQQQFENFFAEHSSGKDEFKSRLADAMKGFLGQTSKFRIKELDSQTERSLSFFYRGPKPETTGIGGLYSIVYSMSFAGLAQAHRHRTVSYNIISGYEKGASKGFFVPPIVEQAGLKDQWLDDLKKIAEKDFPQAQLVEVYERGRIEDFRSKALLRICGHAQLEIMLNTLETAKKYNEYLDSYGKNALDPKCIQGIRCSSPCVWKGCMALERLV